MNKTITIPGGNFQDDYEPRASLICPECTQTTFPPYPHKTGGAWHMPASGGGFYELLQNEMGSWTCSCPGFHFRGRCRHIYGSVEHPGVYALDAQERKRKPASHKPKIKLEDLF